MIYTYLAVLAKRANRTLICFARLLGAAKDGGITIHVIRWVTTLCSLTLISYRKAQWWKQQYVSSEEGWPEYSRR